jgi:ATP diphosphatase
MTPKPGHPKSLSALIQAEAIQLEAAALGFDWQEITPVLSKVDEELSELQEAFMQRDMAAQKDELGDLLFAVVNVARHLQICPEAALKEAGEKFSKRFKQVQTLARESNTPLDTADIEDLDMLWKLAKQQEKLPSSN